MTELINEAATTKPRSAEEVKREEQATLNYRRELVFLKKKLSRIKP